MGVDRGLYERVEQLKSEYGVGIQRAHNIVKIEQAYQQLYQRLAERVPPELLPDADTVQKHSIRLSLMDCDRINRLLPEYFIADEQSKRQHEDLLAKYYSDPEGFAREFKQHFRLKIPAKGILKDMTLPGTAPAWHDQAFIIDSSDNYYRQRYIRGVLEQNLHHLDVEREIARSYIKWHTLNPSKEDIDDVIDSLEKEIQRIKTGQEPDHELRLLQELFRYSLNIPFHEPKPRNLKDAKKSHEIVYSILRGTASKEDEEDFAFRESQYTLRAIIENRKWLEEILSR